MIRLLAFVFLIFAGVALGQPQDLGTEFTYQGNLKQSGSPANGPYDFQFELFDVDAGGAFVGIPVQLEDVQVTEGVFTVELDFGATYFAGDQMYLEISVREGASMGGYSGLLPRQKITAVPYALHAKFVAMSAVGAAEVDSTQVQLRVDDSCAVGSSIRVIAADGTVTCEVDGDTTYTAGAGLDLNGTTLSAVDVSANNELITAANLLGTTLTITEAGANTAINLSGLQDGDTTYTAGSGLTLNGTVFSSDVTGDISPTDPADPTGGSVGAQTANWLGHRFRIIAEPGGLGAQDGRLEFSPDDGATWGTVCDDIFDQDNNTARVVCRSMGYANGVLRDNGLVTDGVGLTYLDDFHCDDNARTLLECRIRPIGSENCSHSEDVGVTCSN